MKRWLMFFTSAVLLIGVSGVSSAAAGEKPAEARQFPGWFYEQPPFRVIDKSMLKLGNTDNPLITITLIDLIYNHGHMCNGVAVGYRAMQEAIRRLFAGQIPVRGEVRIVSNVNSCPTDLFAHVFGVRDHYGARSRFNSLIVPDSCDRNNNMQFIFQRIKKQDGRVKVLKTIKIELIPGTIPAEFYKLHKIVKSKMVIPEDRRRLKQLSQKIYTRIMLAKTEEIFNISELPNFQFPVSDACN